MSQAGQPVELLKGHLAQVTDGPTMLEEWLSRSMTEMHEARVRAAQQGHRRMSFVAEKRATTEQVLKAFDDRMIELNAAG